MLRKAIITFLAILGKKLPEQAGTIPTSTKRPEAKKNNVKNEIPDDRQDYVQVVKQEIEKIRHEIDKSSRKEKTQQVPSDPIPSTSLRKSKRRSSTSSVLNVAKRKIMTKSNGAKDSAPKDVFNGEWLSGGPLGSKAAVLVFRSRAIASSNHSLDRTLPDGKAFLLNKAKHMAKRLVSDANTLENKQKETIIMHDVMASFGNPKAIESQALVVKHTDQSLDAVSKNTPLDTNRERNIDDVLCDLSKITLKREFIENTTAKIDTSPAGLDNKTTKTDTPKIHAKIPKNSSESTKSDTNTGKGRKKTKKCLKENNKQVHQLNTIQSESEESVVDIIPQIDVPEHARMPGAVLNMTYKLVNTETKLLNRLLQAHGLTETPGLSNEFNLLWSGSHSKPDLLRSLSPYQRVNHFPRSYELTRKDKLYKNIEKWQYFRGLRQFDFIPMTFVIPKEYKDLCTAHHKFKGPWIVKPVASSRGRGIYIVSSPESIPHSENVVVAKYIDSPLLVGGHKCDLRLYVCVTSIDPLLIYLYEEGMVRFAAVKYDNNSKHLWNPCMHLCNYSINKYHSDYQKCDDPNAGNVGHKWTLSALLRHLRKQGQNTTELMSGIEDIIVKSILTGTQTMAAAARVFVPHFNNCFELFGYDILIDENLKPWLLEINLSPSLNCESPLDARLKSSLIADTLTLVGIPAVTVGFSSNTTRPNASLKMRIGACRKVHSAELDRPTAAECASPNKGRGVSLTNEEARLVKAVKAQFFRRGGFVRIFPSQNSWQKYAQFLDPVTGLPLCSSSLNQNGAGQSLVTHNYNLLIHSNVLPDFTTVTKDSASITITPERMNQYETVPISRAAPLVAIMDTPPHTPPAVASSSHRNVVKNLYTLLVSRNHRLTPGQARRAFATYLSMVVRRVSTGINPTATLQATLLRSFLRRAPTCLRTPVRLDAPQGKIDDKDKCAIIAKLVNDFLHTYQRETDLYTNTQDIEGCVPNMLFSQFIFEATEPELEEVLLRAATIDSLSWLGCMQLAEHSQSGAFKNHVFLRRLAGAAIRRPHAKDTATNTVQTQADPSCLLTESAPLPIRAPPTDSGPPTNPGPSTATDTPANPEPPTCSVPRSHGFPADVTSRFAQTIHISPNRQAWRS